MLRQVIVFALASGAAAFHLYAAGVAPFTALVQRPVHFALMAVLGFVGLGLRARGTTQSVQETRWVQRLVAGTLIAVTAFSCLYLVVVHADLVRRAGAATRLDLIAGALALVVTLELARRTAGWGLVVVALLAIGYAVSGPALPGLLAHRGYGLERLIEHLYLGTEGIWGVPLGVSADFVYLFVLFGAVLETAGGGALLIGLSTKVAGSTYGGPAKTAAIASAFMGSLSGSAVANVVTTGTLTIPVMKRTGFRPYFAGAIEAAASTGGQLVPPIMGAGAFILATWTNIPYVRVALAATIPAALYYVALLMAIHFRARKMDLPPTSADGSSPVLTRLHLLLPVAVIVFLLAAGRSPMRAAFWGVLSAGGLTLVSRATRLGWEQTRRAIVAAAAGTVQVAAACAAAGIVVGVASLTGIGLRMSEFIVSVSGGNLPVALILTALGSVVIGMGLPTTAAYVVLAALGAPALTEMGVPVLAAHLFIFYFGCLSNVTPPVSLAAYAAAGIAGAPALTTALTALTLAGAGFLVPFIFIYDPALLLDASVFRVVGAGVTAAIGVTALAAATMGFARRRLAPWERALLALAVGALIGPRLLIDLIGIAAVLLVFAAREERAPGPSS